jgi:outer membrane protein OmpA-like peptidoglycan-associated protein
LNWSAPVNNGAAITDYVIKYRITGDLSWITKIDGVNTNTSYVVPNLLNATTYDFQVFAKNSAGDGVGSTVVTGKPFTTPSAPTGISAVSGQGAVTVTWNVPSSDGGSSITDYSIQYKRLIDTSWIDYSHAPSTSTTFTLSSLLQLSQYSFRLAAVNAAGIGTFSAATSQSTLIVAPAITLTSTSGSITIGQAMPVYGVNSTGGTVSSYSVSTLPGGLSFNTSTGVISGTSAALMSASIFTITATNASGTATATYTLTVSAVPVTVPTPVAPAPVVQTGPPPSSLKVVSQPKISRDMDSYYCEIGKYVFLREGRTEESPKLTSRVFSLLLNGKVIEALKTGIDKVSFAKSETYLESTLTCQVEVGQENLSTTSYSLNSTEWATHSLAKKNAIEAADAKYYKDREDAYTKKDLEFARLLAIKNSTVTSSKASKDILAASLTYQKAYTAASNLWKKELADAASNRVLAKELAQKQYLDALEAAGISIYPVAVKAVVTPTPTPTPKPTPTPTPSPTTTNVQPTAAMKLSGTIYMATGSYFLNNATKISLKALALKINATEVKQVLVYGHTDSRGGVNNTWLSQQRAKAVASYLRPLLRGKKLVIGWYASRKPAAIGTSKADLAKNRRVEIYVK